MGWLSIHLAGAFMVFCIFGIFLPLLKAISSAIIALICTRSFRIMGAEFLFDLKSTYWYVVNLIPSSSLKRNCFFLSLHNEQRAWIYNKKNKRNRYILHVLLTAVVLFLMDKNGQKMIMSSTSSFLTQCLVFSSSNPTASCLGPWRSITLEWHYNTFLPSQSVLDSTNEETHKIPKILHQTYKTEDLPEKWSEVPSHWQTINPDWEYKFWTDKLAREFIVENYAWFIPVYDAYPQNIQRVDASRYFILFYYGGVYADLDILPVISLDRLFASATIPGQEPPEVFLFKTANMGVTNSIMATVAHHDFFETMYKILPNYQEPIFTNVFRGWNVLCTTGSTFFWGHYLSYYYSGKKSNSIVVFDDAVFGKIDVCSFSCTSHTSNLRFFTHLVGSSWHSIDTQLENRFFYCDPWLIGTILAGIYKYRRSDKQSTSLHDSLGINAFDRHKSMYYKISDILPHMLWIIVILLSKAYSCVAA